MLLLNMNGNYFTAVTIYTGTVTISLKRADISSGAETNLKVGVTGPEQKWGGGTDPARSTGKIFWSCPSTFWL